MALPAAVTTVCPIPLLASRLSWCWMNLLRTFLSPFSDTFLRCVFYPFLQAVLLFVLSSSVFNPAAQQTCTGPALLPAEHSFSVLPGWVVSLQLSIGPASTGDGTCSPNPSSSVTLFLSCSLLNVSLHLWGEVGLSAILFESVHRLCAFPKCCQSHMEGAAWEHLQTCSLSQKTAVIQAWSENCWDQVLATFIFPPPA